MDPVTNPADGAPLAGTTPAPLAGTPPPTPPAGDVEQISLEAAKKLRQENQALRERAKRLEELEAAEKQRQDADLSAAEKAKKALAEAESRAQAAESRARAVTLERAVSSAAARLKFHDPGDAVALLGSADLGTDPDTGEPDPDKLEKALAALLKRKPWLAPADTTKPATPPGPPSNPPRNLDGHAPSGPIDWQHLPAWSNVLKPPGTR